jgi:glycosyltransferase involved in cell wall biosynthesis
LDRYKGCDRLIGNTPDIVNYFLKNGIPSDRVECIPNFGDIRRVATLSQRTKEQFKISLRIPPNHFLLLALGRLHPSKAHDTLIRAIVPITDVTVIIAGDGPLRPALEALSQELGVADRVHLLGWRTDTAELFVASDISVFPSRFEPFGNVVVESWAQRLPIIAARSVGPAWLIEDGVDGLLFDVDDVEQLTRHIQTLLQQPELGARLVDAGYCKLQQHFSKESIVKRYITMFEDVISCYHKVNY